LQVMMENQPDALVTACPLCKKTFEKQSPVKVMDIAELVKDAMMKPACCSASAPPHPARSYAGELISG
jgi:hypothetical protein